MAFPTTPVVVGSLDEFETRITVLGTTVQDSLGRQRRLVQSAAPIVACDFLTITSANLASSITFALAKTAALLGVCPLSVSCSTSGQNFWAIMNGPAPIRVAAGCQPSVPLYTTDTAGVLDDATASLSQLQIMGVEVDAGLSNSAAGVSVLAATMNNPLVRNPTNA